MFVNDQRSQRTAAAPGKHGGVCIILHGDLSGAESAEHLTHFDVPGRYMMVRVMWKDVEVFIRNVYAPVRATKRVESFNSLPREFSVDSLHIVCGDFNSVLDPWVDSRSPQSNHHASHQALLNWTWELHLVDPWRLHFPEQWVYSGPGRVNRLDMILVSQTLQEQYFHSATYMSSEIYNVAVSDHLLPSLVLKTAPYAVKQEPWRVAKWLLEDPDVEEWILSQARAEAALILRSTNPGQHWQRFKRPLRKQLIQRQSPYLRPAQTEVSGQ